MYKFVLENTKLHHFKRFYLLIVLILSVLLPVFSFINLPYIQANNLQDIYLPELVIQQKIAPVWQSSFQNNQLIFLGIYISGFTISLVYFLYQLSDYRKLKKSATIVHKHGYRFAFSPLINQTFCFYNTIYCPMSISFENDKEIIFHEMVHIQQKHTLDILLQQVLQILFWFNPFIYLYKNPMMLNHEFLADAPFTKVKSAQYKYLQILLNNTIISNTQALSSPFNFKQTKKRFIMITKTNNPKSNFLRVVLASVVMLFTGSYTLIAQSAINQENYQNTDPVYQAVDNQAQYPGGMQAFNQTFITNFQTPKTDVDSYKLVISFVVNKDGNLSDYQVVKEQIPGTGQLAIETLKQMPSWIPGTHKGEVVRSQFYLPITINQVQ
ncbi:M56 family metallopeptidase [Myroides sp. LJL119]